MPLVVPVMLVQGESEMENQLVRYSRAGDVFHYRWAARRCLRMIHPNSSVQQITIEASKERKMAGEYIIDVAEYSTDESGADEISYFQLKHTTVKHDNPFVLSDLKETFEGFARRYKEFLKKTCGQSSDPKVTFSIVTNRPVSADFKKHISELGFGQEVNDRRFKTTIVKYTGLESESLRDFCSRIRFVDGEGDYNWQRHELHFEISQILAGAVDHPQIDSIVALVQEKALPNSDGTIIRSDVLKRLGVTFERELFPAPAKLECPEHLITRKIDVLLDSILNSEAPIIVHAAGGVGKSVFARQVTEALPNGSFGVLYDSFGGGGYRNRSEPRHRHRDALIQIVNELATNGLCEPLIAQSTALPDEIIRKFLSRISTAVNSLQAVNKDAVLVILVDAADNAEMAASEFSEPCFANELLKEHMPDGSRLVMLCRTERIQLLRPSSTVLQLTLKPFSEEETVTNLQRFFPEATTVDGIEFHRLTSGNPRVQANALNTRLTSVEEVLLMLGPGGSTIDEQIQDQLNFAVSKVKEDLSTDYQAQIDAICVGLATLPPFIPLRVLATAADVEESTVRSFVADLGRPLWLSDSAVQFRDEPTETWFREQFSANTGQLRSYIERLKQFANRYTYVAEALPLLLLQAEEYDELIHLAMSGILLPENNPIDKRNVRLYRLQFAFRAALAQQRYDDAIQLALLAGEEVAGDKRQIRLLKDNVHLIGILHDEQRVQDLAFRHVLTSGWDGSENVYSAALLSSLPQFTGEARGYLRAGLNWLRLYFDESKQNAHSNPSDKLSEEDIVQLAHAHLNLYGARKVVDFLLSWQPEPIIYNITQKFIRNLISIGDFDSIEELGRVGSRSQYLMIALSHEMLRVGLMPDAEVLEECLDLLTVGRIRIPKPAYTYENTISDALMSFVESCAAHQLDSRKIHRVIRHYALDQGQSNIVKNYFFRQRDTYLRAVGLKCVLSGDLEVHVDDLLPPEITEVQRKYTTNQSEMKFREVIGALLPWYISRAVVLVNKCDDLLELAKEARRRSDVARRERWVETDHLQQDISKTVIDTLLLCQTTDAVQINKFFVEYVDDNHHMWLHDRLRLVAASFRLDFLCGIRSRVEQRAYEVVQSASNDRPESIAESYIELARAVLPVSRENAAAYFDYAIEALSKFGDEIVERWDAIVGLARHAATAEQNSPELAYRFIRCAELIGENVADEKYFDRSEALGTCAKLSATTALAAMSRWRDRDIGDYDEQVTILSEELVRTGSLSASVGWALSPFYGTYRLSDFASTCITNERNSTRRSRILKMAIHDLRLHEAEFRDWKKLKQVAVKHNMVNDALNDILGSYEFVPEAEYVGSREPQVYPLYDQSTTIPWDDIFAGLELTSGTGIFAAVSRFRTQREKFHSYKTFWAEMISRIDEWSAAGFLQAFLLVDGINTYDIQAVFSLLPDNWRNKASVKRFSGSIFEDVGRRFALEFTHKHRFVNFITELRIDGDVLRSLQRGIIDGFSSHAMVADASTFFGVVQHIVPFVSVEGATTLLGFGLSRFEIHMENSFGDGDWSSWLLPPSDMSVAFAGVVWSALGSPSVKTRWKAAHCVRRLAEMECDLEIHALLSWMRKDMVDAFGSNRLPFYNLHARLYLLIALAQVSLDLPLSEVLREHGHLFEKYALADIPHVLIQKFASEVALNIEKGCSGTFNAETVQRLRRIGISKLPKKKLQEGTLEIESYWHVNGQVDSSIEFYHGYDFDSYWFEPLGRVFGISSVQVSELASHVIIKDWGYHVDGHFVHDPRERLWRAMQHDNATWTSHGSYPLIDSYGFYLSYHAMFTVAARLLDKMPTVVHKQDWYGETWEEWLTRHTLCRQDGRWLADRRDPAPLIKPQWVNETLGKDWVSDISSEDFTAGLVFPRHDDTWLNVWGHWEESDSNYKENYYVASAFVNPQASQALLNALTTCSNPHDFKIPEYQEEGMEFDIEPFTLTGWIWRGDSRGGLDELDPLSGKIPFPPYQLGDNILKETNISMDSEMREWFLPNANKESILAEIWSTESMRNDEPLRNGNRISASLDFLKYLCAVMKADMIFEVQIRRQVKSTSYVRSDDNRGFQPAHSKIYVLSADGGFRDTQGYYEFGKDLS